MPEKEDSTDFLTYLDKVEQAIETFTYCDTESYQFLDFLIRNVPAIRKAALSVGQFKTNTRQAVKTPLGRQAVGRLTTAFTAERAKSIQKVQTQLDQDLKSTQKSVTTNASATREKLDNVERSIYNALLKVKNDITVNLGVDLNRIAAMIEELALQFQQWSTNQHTLLLDVQHRLQNIKEDLTILLTKIQRIANLLEDNHKLLQTLTVKINNINQFVTDFEEKFGEKIVETNNLVVEITALDPRAPGILEVHGALPWLLSGQNAISLNVDAILVNQTDVQNPTLIANSTGIGAILSILLGSHIDPNNIKPDLTNFKKMVKEAISEWFEEEKDSIYSEIVIQVCENIVGESYCKFDSNTTFYPTLLFKFKSMEAQLLTRYSQVQIRLLKQADEIDSNYIQKITQKALILRNFFYFSGALRSNYVAPQRLFKTTVFTKNKTETKKVLSNLLPLGENVFVENQLSYTETMQRLPYSRATISPRSDIQLNPTLKLETRKMKLQSIFLQINGLNKMIKLL